MKKLIITFCITALIVIGLLSLYLSKFATFNLELLDEKTQKSHMQVFALMMKPQL